MGVIIGMDPHKRSATIEVIDERHGVVDWTIRDGQGRLPRHVGRGAPVW